MFSREWDLITKKTGYTNFCMMARKLSREELLAKQDSNGKKKEVGLDSNEKVNPCSMNPESLLFKGLGLLLICIIGFGNDFCVEGPGAMEVCMLVTMDLFKIFDNV